MSKRTIIIDNYVYTFECNYIVILLLYQRDINQRDVRDSTIGALSR